MRSLRPMTLLVTALALLALVAPAPTAASPSTGAEATASGCGQARRAGTQVRTVRVNGMARTYRLSVPPGYTGRVRVPLVVDLHGAGSNAVQEMALTRASQEAARRGWVVATPDAGRTFWYLRAAGGADVAFVRAVVADVNRRLCIAPARRFAMGMSNGSAMAAAMTCAVPHLFSAVAPVTGFNIAGPCLERPVPLLAIHGTADPTVPYRGGPLGGRLNGLLTVPSVPERLRQWSIRNGCTSGPTTTELLPSIVEIRYEGCDAPTVHLKVRGGGHTWPGGPVLPPDRFGPTNQDLDATAAIFDFFEATFRR